MQVTLGMYCPAYLSAQSHSIILQSVHLVHE